MGVRIPRRFHPPAPSVFRVSHPHDVLLRPQPREVFSAALHVLRRIRLHPRWRSWGSPVLRGLARIFRSGQGHKNHEVLLHGVLNSRDEPVLPCSPLGRFVVRARVSLPGTTCRFQRALQGFDRKRSGISSDSESEAPAILKFVADLHTCELEPSTRSLGCPSAFRAPRGAPSSPFGIFRDPAFYSPASLRPTSDPTTNRVVE
jgi:hypothetical protein